MDAISGGVIVLRLHGIAIFDALRRREKPDMSRKIMMQPKDAMCLKIQWAFGTTVYKNH